MKPQMTLYLSDKMKVLSFIAITMVIYIHTYYTEGEAYSAFSTLQRFCGGVGISGVANPLFYFISGYLFFMGMTNVSECFPKIKKRIRTLFVPYLLANTIAFAMYAALDGISRLSPALYNVVNFHILDWFKLDLPTILYNVYWGPVAFQLWFVRDMMIFVLLSPIIYCCMKLFASKRWLAIGSLILLLATYAFTSMHVIWMAIGGIIAMTGIIDITEFGSTRMKDIVMLLCIGIFFIISFLVSANVYEIPFKGHSLFGVIGLWMLYDRIVSGRLLLPKSQWLTTSCSLTFFIYLVHEPTLLIFKKIPLLLSSGELALTLSFLLVPLIFISATIYIGALLRKWIPNAFSLYVGGR